MQVVAAIQNFYVFEVVNAFGFLQGVFLAAVVLFYPGGNRSSNKYLAGHIFFIALILAAPFCQKLFYNFTPRGDRFLEPSLLLIYPCLYLYVKSLSERIRTFEVLSHMLPFVLYIPLVVWSLIKQFQIKQWGTSIFGFDIVLLLFVLIKATLFVVYLWLCWKRIVLLQNKVLDSFSEISRINVNWARQLIFAGIGIIVIYLLVMGLIINDPDLIKLNFVMVFLLTAYIYFATFKGLIQPEIFKRVSDNGVSDDEAIEIAIEEPEKIKYERSSLSETRQDELVGLLQGLMTNERLFLEPELNIQVLADRLKISPYYVSQVLNQKLKRSFYDFVNFYRVEEAKKLLLGGSHEKFTILAIAFESGFNSKTTFNTVFKKFTAQTPTQFKSRINA